MINYGILAHDNPRQIYDLVMALNVINETRFIIHIDAKCDLMNYSDTIVLSNVYFVKDRIKVEWGTISVVYAVEKILTEITNSFSDGYFILISGSTYPIKSNDYIHKFIENNNQVIFSTFVQYPNDQLKYGGLDRFNKVWHSNGGRGGLIGFEPRNIKITNLLFFLRVFKNAKSRLNYIWLWLTFRPLSHINFVHGEMWFTLPYNDLRIFLDKLKNVLKDKRVSYLKIPDEIIIPTICKSICKERHNNNCLIYVEWSENIWPRPTIFIKEDFSRLNNLFMVSDKLFIRKIDYNIDSSIVQHIKTLR